MYCLTRSVTFAVPVIFPAETTKPTNPNVYFGLKHYEWKCLMTSGVTEYCVAGLLGQNQEKAWFEVIDALRNALTYEVDCSLAVSAVWMCAGCAVDWLCDLLLDCTYAFLPMGWW